ncbi:TIGR03790 family protein [Paucibacter sp. AS339]|uniref:TIGR03790 family protein n=1 Tax=Paucibacter hankyongi TaxID=3133434 RepID=UPI0030A22170
MPTSRAHAIFKLSTFAWRLLAGLSLAILLAACGGGGASSSTAATPTPTPTPVGSATSSFGLSLPSAGLKAQDLGVIVAEGDVLSEAVAAYYQSARGVPASNIIRVKLNTGAETISANDFAALKADIDAKLPTSVQATLLTWIAPTRVVGTCAMSITSALAFGYDAKYCGAGCASTAASPYYDTESNKPWTDHKFRPSMMLGARTLDAARSLIDRGVRADASQPSGSGYLLRTSDAARSVRYGDYTGLPASWAGRLQLSYTDNSAGAASDGIVGKADVLFYFTGKAVVPNLSSNSFLPGAAADHLTSFGGALPSGWGQMPITDWLDAGATASYGTVEEPCNYTQKFSQASVLIDHYYRGATLIEAYWKSVQWPGQGLFVGEPLAKPFADQASFSLEGGQYLIKTRSLRPNGNYTLEFRSGPTGSWTSLATFKIVRAEQQTLNAPLPPASATQLRWRGPCPDNNSLQCTLSESP